MMSPGITASRRGPVPSPRKYSRTCIAAGSMLPMRFPINCVKNGMPFELITRAVRLRVRGRHRHQLDLAGGWSQPANHVPLLHGEPERALLVEDRRVRTTRRWIGDLVFGDHARFGIELPEVSILLAGIPDVPILVGHEPMRPHAVRQLCVIGPEWIVPDFTGARIETTQAAARLARIPDGAVGRYRGIVRPRARCDLPLSDRCLDGSRHPYTCRPRGTGQRLGQIRGDAGHLLLRQRQAVGAHEGHDALPFLRALARPEGGPVAAIGPGEFLRIMAAHAVTLHEVLARAVRQAEVLTPG